MCTPLGQTPPVSIIQMAEFLIRSIVAAAGAALAAGPLGCFVVWRRMAYFGDATAHASILGVALALTLEVSVFAGVLSVAIAMAATVSLLSERGFATDTLLGVLATQPSPSRS